jgi:hypothetical protein
VPIVTGIGALRDRVTHGENGFIVNVNDAAAVIGYLELLRADPAMLAAMRARITPALWVRDRAHAEAVLGIYRSIAPRKPLGATALGFDIGQLHLLPHAHWRELAPPRHIFDPSRDPNIALDLPEEITHWIHVNGSEGYIDSIAGSLIGKIESGAFEVSDQLSVVGWTFVPQMGISGQVTVALVGEDGETTIFLRATRQLRDDIAEAFPGAPQQAGFTAHCALHGKWSDGRYRIATINTFGERAAFNLTPISLRLDSGKVTNVWLRRTDDAEVLQSFEQVASRAGPGCHPPLPALRIGRLNADPAQALCYNIEEFQSGSTCIGPAGGSLTPTRLLSLRGWAFQTSAGAASGNLYLGLVSPQGGIPAFWPTQRHPRVDVKGIHGEAPERAGFATRIEKLPDMADGTWHVVVCNMIGDAAVAAVTRVFLAVRDGRFKSVGLAELDDATSRTLLHAATGVRLPDPPQADSQAPAAGLKPAPAAAPPRRRARR